MPEISVIDQIATALRDSTIPSDRVSSWMCRWSLLRGAASQHPKLSLS